MWSKEISTQILFWYHLVKDLEGGRNGRNLLRNKEYPTKEKRLGQRTARRMRRVPFKLLQGSLDEATAKMLIRRCHMRKELAQAFKGHLIDEPEDLLRIPALVA